MKKIFLTILLLLTVPLSACGASPEASETQNTSEEATAVAELVNQGLTAIAPIATNTIVPVISVELTSDYEMPPQWKCSWRSE